MKMREKQIFLAALAMALSMIVGGCERHQKSEHYFLIATNINLTYWQSAHEGFTRAAAQYGVTEDMRGPDTFNPAIEVDEFRAAVARKPAGILVSVSDPRLMGPEINKAIGRRDSRHHHRLRCSRQPAALLHRHQQPGGGAVGRPIRGRPVERQRECRLLHHARPAQS